MEAIKGLSNHKLTAVDQEGLDALHELQELMADLR